MTHCDHCGRENDEASTYCADCGRPIGRGPDGVTGPARAVAAPDDRGSGSMCPQCGQPLAHRRSRPLTSPVSLVLLDDSGEESGRHLFKREETSIGRVDADIVLEDPFMSPVHAQISVRGDDIYIRDLGSRNGTWMFLEEPYRLQDGDLILIGSQVIQFRRLGYPGPQPPEQDQTRRLGSLVPGADIAKVTQLRSDGSARDVLHLSPGRPVVVGREGGDWVFPYDPSMSGGHAEIRSEDADFVIVDQGSRNGVAVAVRGEVRLPPGTRVLAGDRIMRVEKP